MGLQKPKTLIHTGLKLQICADSLAIVVSIVVAKPLDSRKLLSECMST